MKTVTKTLLNNDVLSHANAIHGAMANLASHPSPPVDISKTESLPPLACSAKSGDRYVRPPNIDAEILRMRRLARSQWVAQARNLQNETLVCLIRLTHQDDPSVCGSLIEELQKRITHRARAFCRDMDDYDEEQFINNVEIRVLELVLTKEQSRKRDVLEVAFGQAVKRLALDELKKFENSTAGNIADLAVDTTDLDWDGEEEIERPIEFLPETKSGPEDILLNLDMGKHGHRLLRKALQAVPDPRHREAAILHWGRGIPIESCRDKDCLTRRFRKDARQIKYWLAIAMKQMRDALGIA